MLSMLLLENNHLTTLESEVFAPPGVEIAFLLLDNNRLMSIGENVFPESIRILSLMDNNLQTLPWMAFQRPATVNMRYHLT